MGNRARRARVFDPAIEDADRLVVPVLVLYEVVKKVRREHGEAAALEAAALLRSGRIVDVDSEIALDAAQLELPLADSLIYTIARRAGATLWSKTRTSLPCRASDTSPRSRGYKLGGWLIPN